MSEVYRNAFCTSSASLICTESTGMFRQTDKNSVVDITMPGAGAGVKSFRLFPRPTKVDVLIHDNPLQSRGWCFQERELSPRVVHWTTEQIIWECREHLFSESIPVTDCWRWRTNREFEDVETVPDEDLYVLWLRTIESYSGRELTVSGDRFPALGGLARIVAQRLKVAYCAGFWATDLRRSLLRETHFYADVQKTDQYIAPSWSWAAAECRVIFANEIISSVFKRNDSVTITEVQVDLLTSDPYGAISGGRLHMRVPVFTASVIPEKANHWRWGWKCWKLKIPEMEPRCSNWDEPHYTTYDVEADANRTREIRCIILGEYLGASWGISLAAVDGKLNTYRRIGLTKCRGPNKLLKTEVEDIILI